MCLPFLKFPIVSFLFFPTVQGFCGVRFNPYLWAEGGEGMKDETGMALYRKAGELNMPVGVMCFKGLGLHMQDIEALLKSSPQTKVVVFAPLLHVWCLLHSENLQVSTTHDDLGILLFCTS